jgi:hypothetical protein
LGLPKEAVLKSEYFTIKFDDGSFKSGCRYTAAQPLSTKEIAKQTDDVIFAFIILAKNAP